MEKKANYYLGDADAWTIWLILSFLYLFTVGMDQPTKTAICHHYMIIPCTQEDHFSILSVCCSFKLFSDRLCHLEVEGISLALWFCQLKTPKDTAATLSLKIIFLKHHHPLMLSEMWQRNCSSSIITQQDGFTCPKSISGPGGQTWELHIHRVVKKMQEIQLSFFKAV